MVADGVPPCDCCETKFAVAEGVAPGMNDVCVATEDADILLAGLAGLTGAKDDGDAGKNTGVGPTGFTAEVAVDDCPEAGRAGGYAADEPAGEAAVAPANGMCEVVGVGVGVECADEGVAVVFIAFGLLPCLFPLPLWW